MTESYKEIEVDFGTTIDRTIPNGTKVMNEYEHEYIFNDGYWISTSIPAEKTLMEND